MKIILLSDANSAHTLKWAQSIKENNFDLLLFSFFKPDKYLEKKYKMLKIKIISPDLRSKVKNLSEPNLSKIRYFTSIILLKKTINQFQPNIIHAHYASSYGLLGFLSMFRPFILSVWGSDIYHFPYKNIINKFLIKIVIRYSDIICSTSIAMKKIIEKEYGRMDVKIIPFGIDTTLFRPSSRVENFFTVGTIKSIEAHNGIDCLLEAARLIVHDHKKNINFLIVGKGSLSSQMKKKVSEFNLTDHVNFTGYINPEEVQKYYKKLSVFIAVSTRESFGVSVLEAAACGIPSITSNIGGLKEVNLENKTGLLINPNDPKKLANSILFLYKNNKKRIELGKNARKRVVQDFNWNDNVRDMKNIYYNFNENSFKKQK